MRKLIELVFFNLVLLNLIFEFLVFISKILVIVLVVQDLLKKNLPIIFLTLEVNIQLLVLQD